MIQHRQQLWRRSLTSVMTELEHLDPRRRDWIAEATRGIAMDQQRMHELFLAADGPALCRCCQGACCACGAHHFTLTNLLAYLIEGDSPPQPDFTQTCPFLDSSGCRLPVARRPFNCVIFLCEEVWANLSEQQKQEARSLEAALRRRYLAFDGYFAGSSLRGLLIRAERLDCRKLLADPAGHGVAVG
jgi:hypothetical protein